MHWKSITWLCDPPQSGALTFRLGKNREKQFLPFPAEAGPQECMVLATVCTVKISNPTAVAFTSEVGGFSFVPVPKAGNILYTREK